MVSRILSRVLHFAYKYEVSPFQYPPSRSPCMDLSLANKKQHSFSVHLFTYITFTSKSANQAQTPHLHST